VELSGITPVSSLVMAMTLRFTDEETEAMRAQAERESRSMQAVARAASREYIEHHAHRARCRFVPRRH
jgi:hypothetical protein